MKLKARATREKTARLKSLRLAKEAQAQAEEQTPKQPKQRPANKGKTSAENLKV